jgi:hypothetical protein
MLPKKSVISSFTGDDRRTRRSCDKQFEIKTAHRKNPSGCPSRRHPGSLSVHSWKLALGEDFPNNAHPPIPIEGNYEIATNGTALYFSDSSRRKLASTYTYTPMMTVATSAL